MSYYHSVHLAEREADIFYVVCLSICMCVLRYVRLFLSA